MPVFWSTTHTISDAPLAMVAAGLRSPRVPTVATCSFCCLLTPLASSRRVLIDLPSA